VDLLWSVLSTIPALASRCQGTP